MLTSDIMASFVCLFFCFIVLTSVGFSETSTLVAGASSSPLNISTYYLNSGLPSTWYNNNLIDMKGSKMSVFLAIQQHDVGFYCGFFCNGPCDSYLFSVVAVGGGSHNVVWSANTQYPVHENSTVQLTRDEGLVLRDSDASKVWSTNTSGNSVVGMNLTEAGNLVIFDNQSAMLWQSFDHPTDTLLIGQRLYEGQKLIASFSSTNWSYGLYYANVTSTAGFAAFVDVGQGQSHMYYQLMPEISSSNSSGLNYAEFERTGLLITMGTSQLESGRNPLEFPVAYFIEYIRLESDGSLTIYQHNKDSSFKELVAPSPALVEGFLPPQSSGKRTNLAAAMVAGSTAGAFIVCLTFIVLLVILRRTNREDGEALVTIVPGMPLSFSYEDLRVATNDFNDILGSGGFGSVFKGMIADGTRIAVKRLDKMGQGMREFLAEVETIGSIHHFNLVRLIGFCAEKSLGLLVYEHMSNGSLDNWIFFKDERPSLDWQTRKKIILDIAKGLAYLHEDCRQKIVHLDIKPQNILLDENFNAKVSDFGLSKLIDRGQSQVLTTMRGTPGYLAPEWRQSRITVKVDIYSFGIVVLEIVCRRKNFDHACSESKEHLLSLLQKKAEEDRLIDIVENLDEDMGNHREEMLRMIRIGAWCLQDDPTRRPLMSTVVKVLEGVMEVDPNIIFKFTHALASSPIPIGLVSSAPQASVLSNPR